MTDQELPVAAQAERIAKLEEQVRELQSKVAAMQKQWKQQRHKRRGVDLSDLGDALTGDVLAKTFMVLVFVGLAPGVFSMFAPSSASDSWLYFFTLFPGDEAVWLLFWQITMLVTFLVGAVIFIASRD